MPTTLDTLEMNDPESHSTLARVLMWTKAVFSSVALYLFPAGYLCTLWSWKATPLHPPPPHPPTRAGWWNAGGGDGSGACEPRGRGTWTECVWQLCAWS